MTPDERAKAFVKKYRDSHVVFVASRLEELLEQAEADAIQRTRKAIRDALATEADLSSNWNVGKRPGAASRAYGMASGLCMTVEVR